MANTVQNTFNKVSNTLEALFGGGGGQEGGYSDSGVPSALEKYGIQARKYHLMRNEWKKDLQYTRSLVNAEYQIQTEFKIDGGSGDGEVVDLGTVDVGKNKDERKLAKLNKQKKKLQDKINKLENKIGPKEVNN